MLDEIMKNIKRHNSMVAGTPYTIFSSSMVWCRLLSLVVVEATPCHLHILRKK
jgi:hypothetical protein